MPGGVSEYNRSSQDSLKDLPVVPFLGLFRLYPNVYTTSQGKCTYDASDSSARADATNVTKAHLVILVQVPNIVFSF